MEQDAIAAIRENAAAVSHLGDVLVSKDETARELEQRRWDQQQARWDDEQVRYGALRDALRVVKIAVAVVVLAVVANLLITKLGRDDTNRVIDQNAAAADLMSARFRLSEAQRKCEADLVANAIGRARTQPVADPALLNRLREDLSASYLQPDEGHRDEVLTRIRDEVRQILGQVPSDDPILHVRELCYTGTPSDDPVHDQNTTPTTR